MKKILLVVFVLVFPSVSQAEMKPTKMKAFGGNCMILTEKDNSSDKTNIVMGCTVKDNYKSSIRLDCASPSNRFITLKIGYDNRPGKMIPVKYSFDSGRIVKADWTLEDSGVRIVNKNPEVFKKILSGIGNAKKFSFQIGDEKQEIVFVDGKGAAMEYSKRCDNIKE